MRPTSAVKRSTQTEALAERYLAAWQAHDLDAIISLHTPDSVFTSVATGLHAIGRQAVRDAISEILSAWPDLHFYPDRIYTTDTLIVAESTVTTTPALPLTVESLIMRPNGRKIKFTVADVIKVENGLVKRKDSYVDMLSYLRQTRCEDPA